MAETTAVVYAPAVMSPERTAAFAVEVARVGAALLRLPAVDAATRAAVSAATELLVLDPDDQPIELLLGANPVAELHSALGALPASALVVGGQEVAALLAGLAGGTHLRAGSADTPGDGSLRHDVQLVARAVALSRLAGRPPMPLDEARARWG